MVFVIHFSIRIFFRASAVCLIEKFPDGPDFAWNDNFYFTEFPAATALVSREFNVNCSTFIIIVTVVVLGVWLTSLSLSRLVRRNSLYTDSYTFFRSKW